MVDNKYIKVVYRSEPIGKEGIVLELTTFDKEKYEKDQKLQKVKKIAYVPVPKERIANGIITNETQQCIKEYLTERVAEENKKLMEIIENQQKQIEQLNDLVIEEIKVREYEV